MARVTVTERASGQVTIRLFTIVIRGRVCFVTAVENLRRTVLRKRDGILTLRLSTSYGKPFKTTCLICGLLTKDLFVSVRFVCVSLRKGTRKPMSWRVFLVCLITITFYPWCTSLCVSFVRVPESFEKKVTTIGRTTGILQRGRRKKPHARPEPIPNVSREGAGIRRTSWSPLGLNQVRQGATPARHCSFEQPRLASTSPLCISGISSRHTSFDASWVILALNPATRACSTTSACGKEAGSQVSVPILDYVDFLLFPSPNNIVELPDLST